jgi:hypothetical protein
MSKSEQDTKVVLGKNELVRFSYANVFEPRENLQGDDKYGVSVLIPKSDEKTVKLVKAAIKAAVAEGKDSKFGGKVPSNIKLPLRDGDEERADDPAYAGHYFFNANSNRRPSVVDKTVSPILDPDEFYSGCYGRVSVNFYSFNTNGNKGVAAGLNNIQKVKDGERLGGGSSAEEDFGSFADEDEMELDDLM